jgi:hypothetical protein
MSSHDDATRLRHILWQIIRDDLPRLIEAVEKNRPPAAS